MTNEFLPLLLASTTGQIPSGTKTKQSTPQADPALPVLQQGDRFDRVPILSDADYNYIDGLLEQISGGSIPKSDEDFIDGLLTGIQRKPPLPQKEEEFLDGLLQGIRANTRLPKEDEDRIDNLLTQVSNPTSPLPQEDLDRIDSLLDKIKNPPARPADDEAMDDINHNLEAISRYNTPIDKQMRKFGLNKFNKDGSYSKLNDPSIRFYYQPGGGIYSREKKRTFANGAWGTADTEPMPWTYGIAKERLQPTELHLVFTKPGHTGKYIMQPDGTIFYTGGKGPNGDIPPQTYVNGEWKEAQNTIHPLSMEMLRLNLIPNPDGTYSKKGDTGTYTYQPGDKSLFYSGGQRDGVATPPSTFHDGAWDNARNTPVT